MHYWQSHDGAFLATNIHHYSSFCSTVKMRWESHYFKQQILLKEINTNKNKAGEERHKLFNLFLHSGHSFSLRTLKPVGGAAKVAQHVMTLIMQEDVLHLSIYKA